MTISLLSFQHQFNNDRELTSAASVIAVVPVVALFLVFQGRFIAGMTAGGLRGQVAGRNPT